MPRGYLSYDKLVGLEVKVAYSYSNIGMWQTTVLLMRVPMVRVPMEEVPMETVPLIHTPSIRAHIGMHHMDTTSHLRCNPQPFPGHQSIGVTELHVL